jgi:hypothetical protein
LLLRMRSVLRERGKGRSLSSYMCCDQIVDGYSILNIEE